MNKITSIFVFLSLIFLVSCGGETEEHKILHEAADIHNEAVKVKKEASDKLNELRQISNSIMVQGRELTPAEIAFSEKVASMEMRINYWDENHIEVPGFDHEGHDHSGHDHSHDHGTQMSLPAKDMLILQKELRDSIVVINRTLESLMQQVPK